MNIEIEHPTDRPNFTRLDLTGPDGRHAVIWYSYSTPIAVRWRGQTVIRANQWGPTTGKHINYVKADSNQILTGIDGYTFQAVFDTALNYVYGATPYLADGADPHDDLRVCPHCGTTADEDGYCVEVGCPYCGKAVIA